jgi:hypothetical protein
MPEIVSVRAISNGQYRFTVKSKGKSKGKCLYEKFYIIIDCCPKYISLEQIERDSWIKEEYKQLITPGIIEWINNTKHNPHDDDGSRETFRILSGYFDPNKKTKIHKRNYRILHAKKNFNFSKLEQTEIKF